MVGVVGSSPIAPTSLCLAPLPARRFAKTLLQTPKQDILLARKPSSTSNPPEADPQREVATRLIKKYPNRRLYDTQTSSYITLQEVKAMVIDAETIKVIDAKSEEDLTRSIFLQIILEEEAGGLPLFSEAALANMIRFYGHAMQPFMGNFQVSGLARKLCKANHKTIDSFVFPTSNRFSHRFQLVFGTKGILRIRP